MDNTHKLELQSYLTSFGTGYHNKDSNAILVLSKMLNITDIEVSEKGVKTGNFHSIADDSVIFSQSKADELLAKADMFATHRIVTQIEGSEWTSKEKHAVTGKDVLVTNKATYDAIKLVKRSSSLVNSDSGLII